MSVDTPQCITAVQMALAAAGRDPGPVDGILGPKTYAALFAYGAMRTLGEVGLRLGRAAAQHFPQYDVDANHLRIAHFIAQASHETGLFRNFVEIGGPTYCARYDWRKDLGNQGPGDGYRFRGRGIFQLTGRANYQRYGSLCGLDLISQPDKAADLEVSVHLACLYWRDRGLNALADANDVAGVTRKINGGTNGFYERLTHTNRLVALFREAGA